MRTHVSLRRCRRMHKATSRSIMRRSLSHTHPSICLRCLRHDSRRLGRGRGPQTRQALSQGTAAVQLRPRNCGRATAAAQLRPRIAHRQATLTPPHATPSQVKSGRNSCGTLRNPAAAAADAGGGGGRRRRRPALWRLLCPSTVLRSACHTWRTALPSTARC